MDNIRRTGKGGFLVAVPMVIEEGFNPAVDVLFKYPFVQRFLSRLIYALGRLPEIIDEYCYPSPRLREFAYWTRDAIQSCRVISLRGHPYMTSAQFWDFLATSPTCPHLGLIYSTKFTQPPLLHLLLG